MNSHLIFSGLAAALHAIWSLQWWHNTWQEYILRVSQSMQLTCFCLINSWVTAYNQDMASHRSQVSRLTHTELKLLWGGGGYLGSVYKCNWVEYEWKLRCLIWRSCLMFTWPGIRSLMPCNTWSWLQPMSVILITMDLHLCRSTELCKCSRYEHPTMIKTLQWTWLENATILILCY